MKQLLVRSFQIVSLSMTLFALVAFSSGCAKSSSPSMDDPILNSYRLIDEHRTDEAIELLESSSAEEPTRTDLKSVLASAYAHKAGIRIQTLVPVFFQADKVKKVEVSVEAEESKTLTAGQQLNHSVVSLGQLLKRFSGFSEAYASIPLVDRTRVIYLIHAIDVLNEIGPNLKPEDALYRAVLETILFKYILAEELIGEFMASGTNNEKNCHLNLGHVNDSVIKLGRLLIQVYTDIGTANPAMSADTKKISEKTADAVSNVTIATTAVTVLDEAATMFMKQTLIQNGFGKIIKCGGGG